jgi:hypothetical protein
MDDGAAGRSLVLLTRALRGAAFVGGALFRLRGEKQLEEAQFTIYYEVVDAISKQIVELIRAIRDAQKHLNP